MFYSHSQENEKFTMFSLLLAKLMTGDQSYKEAVDPVIHEAACLFKGETTLYTISNRDSLPIIIYLKEQGKELLPALDKKVVFDIEDYKKVFNIVQSYSHMLHI